MRFKPLIPIMKTKSLKSKHELKDCTVVIDGRSYFQGTYKESGCEYIVGGEYDRYANYLKKKLNGFIESNVTCYVVFNGATNLDTETKKVIHQKTIDNMTEQNAEKYVYFEPIFAKDVCKQVLDELNIKYFVSEYDSRKDITGVAKSLDCCVVTNNLDYFWYGVSCVKQSSIEFNKDEKKISCQIYKAEILTKEFTVRNDMLPILLTLVDETDLYYEKLPDFNIFDRKNLILSVFRWIRRQNENTALDSIRKNLESERAREMFSVSYCETRKVIFNSRRTKAVKYFVSCKPPVLFSTDDWFENGVSYGRIAVPYINLKNYNVFIGSSLHADKNKNDAMLSSMDIVMYAYGLLTNSQNLTIDFVGRKSDKCCAWEIKSNFVNKMCNAGFLKKFGPRKKTKKTQDLLCNFLNEILPGLHLEMLNDLPEDVWILIIAVVYICRKDKEFLNVAYCVMLSYVILGPVTEKVGLIKRSNFSINHNQYEDNVDRNIRVSGLSYRDCVMAANAFMDLFYLHDIKQKFDCKILHLFAKFQHCLQHINYVNKLCGEKLKCTNYYKTYNATFVYNIFLIIKDKDDPVEYLEGYLKHSPSVLPLFKYIIGIFNSIMGQF